MSEYRPYTDEHLVAILAIEAEARGAFTELYERYWKRMLVHAAHKLGDQSEAEEVVQDVFMNLWRRKESLAIRNSFNTYISSCVKYEVLARLAKQQSKREFERRNFDPHLKFDETTLNMFDFETTRKKIEETIKTLPAKCQLVFKLSRQEGLTEKQIAQELKISPKTVEAHISKALKIIRSAFKFFLFILLILSFGVLLRLQIE